MEFETFFKLHENRIHFQIHRLGINKELYATFYAEGIFALWQAYKNYTDEKGVLGTYVNYYIRYRLIDLLRKKQREQDATETVIKREVERLHNGNTHRASRMPIIGMDEVMLTNQAFWDEVKAQLTTNQWKWVHYFIIADLTVKEIMEVENVSADAVKGWGRAVKHKLRNERLRKKLLKLI